MAARQRIRTIPFPLTVITEDSLICSDADGSRTERSPQRIMHTVPAMQTAVPMTRFFRPGSASGSPCPVSVLVPDASMAASFSR